MQEHAKGGKCIVFTQTKRDADRLSHSMSRSFQCEALHGDISQSQRERTLGGFRDGRFNILIATDVAARGLDIPNVDLVCASPFLSYLLHFCNHHVHHLFPTPHVVIIVQVIHYELPNSSEIFVHRSGRTGRAGKKGTAIVMYNYEQSRAVRVIERDVGCKFTEVRGLWFALYNAEHCAFICMLSLHYPHLVFFFSRSFQKLMSRGLSCWMLDLTPSGVEVEGMAVQTMGAHGALVDVGVVVLADQAADSAILDLAAQVVDLVTQDLTVLVVEGLAGQVEVVDSVTQDLAAQVAVEDSVTQGLVAQVVVGLVLVVLVDLVILVQAGLVVVLVVLAQVVSVALVTRTHDRLLEVITGIKLWMS